MAQVDLFRMPNRPWNSGRIIGAKPPFKPKHIWGIRQQLRTAGKVRDLALFNCALDAKLRGCDLVKLAARGIYEAAGRATITDDLREIRDFYEQPAECLWITFGRGRLWWAYSDPHVRLRDDGVRERATLAPWSCLDAQGRELRINDLSTSLTQTAAYRRTICSVTALETYLLRRLNAEADAQVERVEGLMADLTTAVGTVIADLHWRDFEVLVDLIFARSGWRRVAAVGGSGQADSDLILQQAVTGERAFVQVKSKATPATLRDYQARFEDYPNMDRFFFACHTPRGPLEAPNVRRQHQ